MRLTFWRKLATLFDTTHIQCGLRVEHFCLFNVVIERDLLRLFDSIRLEWNFNRLPVSVSRFEGLFFTFMMSNARLSFVDEIKQPYPIAVSIDISL